jgi:hypothetical protein
MKAAVMGANSGAEISDHSRLDEIPAPMDPLLRIGSWSFFPNLVNAMLQPNNGPA